MTLPFVGSWSLAATACPSKWAKMRVSASTGSAASRFVAGMGNLDVAMAAIAIWHLCLLLCERLLRLSGAEDAEGVISLVRRPRLFGAAQDGQREIAGLDGGALLQV